MPADLGAMTVWMGPTTTGGPDDLESAIVDFINEAKVSLDVAVQEPDHRPIVDALIARRQAGVVVRIILESDYLTVNNVWPTPWVLVAITSRTGKPWQPCNAPAFKCVLI